MDANFKQKARSHANDARNIQLGSGWGCVVDWEEYSALLKAREHENEISHCVRFSAIWNTNKKSKSLRATGISVVTCSQHELFWPNGIGDLQKGERYSNMDTIFLMSVFATGVKQIYISYDIVCQWMCNFFPQMNSFPEHLQIPQDCKITFKVPKFHLPAHVPACYAPFTFNYTVGIGKTDGEGPECNWSMTNDIAKSSSIMTKGTCFENIDNHCNFTNYWKTIDLGM
ncbi:hypothetical protein Moror_9209 [Moniliophthora roreri MCA 2997]|uniref:Uncharacterized protein n=1 Tax=Moniliophthora roreri (strain MCA 2997) TaxID=1381753 RepID=V2WXM1_MONRO|nr:hypothetical protein Moror_9209 [Moniliophthora roreri MCA 2997]